MKATIMYHVSLLCHMCHVKYTLNPKSNINESCFTKSNAYVVTLHNINNRHRA